MPRSGISYSNLFEWVLAAKWSGYRTFDFFELTGDRQSFIVAAYRLNNLVESVLAKDQADQARRAGARKKGKM